MDENPLPNFKFKIIKTLDYLPQYIFLSIQFLLLFSKGYFNEYSANKISPAYLRKILV